MPQFFKKEQRRSNLIFNLKANNEYLYSNVDNALMVVHPSWDVESCESILKEKGFLGFKPYPALVTKIKGAEISIFDFITHDQLKILDKHKKILLLHLPRKPRLHDEDNINELRIIKNKYPDVQFGTDFPIMMWHGKRIWLEEKEQYINLAREKFNWNKHIEGNEKEKRYTLYVYEQIMSILNTVGENKDLVNDVFLKNAERLIKQSQW